MYGMIKVAHVHLYSVENERKIPVSRLYILNDVLQICYISPRSGPLGERPSLFPAYLQLIRFHTTKPVWDCAGVPFPNISPLLPRSLLQNLDILYEFEM